MFLRNISRIRKYIPQHTRGELIKSLIIYRLDYGLFDGLPKQTVSGLKAVQNFGARIVPQGSLQDHDSMLRALILVHNVNSALYKYVLLFLLLVGLHY